MILTNLHITNFRSIENLKIEFGPTANVIVGPNAIGKTSILEAIRVAKAILSPRTPEEATQVFVSLGAIVAPIPQQINFAAVAGNPTKNLEIWCVFQLNENDKSILSELVPQIANSLVRARLAANSAQGELGMVQFLSSPAGQSALKQANESVSTELPPLLASSKLNLRLIIDPVANSIRGTHQLDQIAFNALESKLPAHQAAFSYFPADRALPTGEVNIQVGAADALAQLQSHNAAPQTKYNRLKATIINRLIFDEANRTKLSDDFNKLFSHILKDRELHGVRFNQFGQLNIEILEKKGGRVFDIDAMSSGEKGLILTFLLISHAVCDGGIIAIDEPELHLNPAVCKLLLPFLIDEYLKPKNVQAIICSHSPEILGSSFDRLDCSLYHLQSSKIISKIFPEDKREVFDALKRLGTTTSDILFSSGSIFVEGDHDVEILETGFNRLIGRYKVTKLGGRPAVEREIETLQSAEGKAASLETLKCFIFDLDNIPTGLKSTKLIKVLQWKKRCLENYLIDEKIIYELLKTGDYSSKNIESRGEVTNIFRNIALAQLPLLAVRTAYEKMNYENAGLRPKELLDKTYSEAAEILFRRLKIVQDQTKLSWSEEFVKRCTQEEEIARPTWESDWLALCDGKRFFQALHRDFGVKVSPLKFKKLIISEMERTKTDSWTLISSLLTDALNVSG